MSLITFLAYYKSCEETTPVDNKKNPHKTAEFIGKSTTAFIIGGGAITLYVLSILGIIGMGPFAHFPFAANVSICSVLAGVDALTVLGLALRTCGFGVQKKMLSKSTSFDSSKAIYLKE